MATTTPELTAVSIFNTGYNDYNGCATAYDYTVTTAKAGGETVADSGWLDYDEPEGGNETIWTVPDGALRDGETYWVSVWTDDTELCAQNHTTPCPGPPLTPTTITSFEVKLRQGSGGPSPTDSVGSSSSGTTTPAAGSPSPGLAPASETVNLLTGDLALTAGTHSVTALAGSPGVSLNYNSLDADVYGLDAQYFLDTGDHSFSPSDLIGQKTDPMIDFDFGLTPVGSTPPNDGFLVRWTGLIYFPAGSPSVPTGSWQVGVQAGGGMAVCLNLPPTATCSSSNAAVYSWSQGASESSPVFSPTLTEAQGPHNITVQTWVPDGTSEPTVLWIRNMTSGAAPPTTFIVPSTWLSSTPASLPAGWSLSGGSYNTAWTGLVDDGSQVVLTAADGSTADFLGSGTGTAETFQPPTGDTDLLTRQADGTLKLATRAGDVYTFTLNGLVSSITTAEDATARSGSNPATLEYTYAGDPLQLTAIKDPVSGQSVALAYNGNGTCPAETSTGVTLNAPVDMLCAINYWDGTQSTFAYYPLGGPAAGELAEVDNPGGVSQFGYDGAGRLDDLRDPLAYAAIQAGQRSDCPAGSSSTPTCDTTIGYMVAATLCSASFTPSCAQVATVTQPAPDLGGAQPARTYCYADSPATSTCTPTSSTTTVSVAGFNPTSGYDNKVVYNATGEIVSGTGPTGATTTTTWDSAERPVTTVNPQGLQTTTVYDLLGDVTDTYGPAPASCFLTTAPYLPVTGAAACPTSLVAHTHSGYDEGISGPNTSIWSNLTLSGPPCQDTTGLSGDTALSHVWGTTVPACADASGAWSLGMTGMIDLPSVGTWSFQLASQSNLSVAIDGALLGQATGNGSWGSTITATLPVTAPGWHQIEIDYVPIENPTGSQSNGFTISDQPPGGSMTTVPYSAIDPGYGLKTSTVDPDGKVTISTYADPAGGIDPIDGLVTASIEDPSTATVSADGFPASLGDASGLSLTTQTGYEPPGAGSYFRKTSSTLPAGNVTAYTYYSGTAGPQAAVCGVSSTTLQVGLLEQQTDPVVSGSSLIKQFVYDAAGRQVGLREGSTATIASAGWQCTSYDSSGRMTSQSWPANGSAPARTATYSYAVGGNPLTNSVSDSNGTVTSTVDLLGRVVSYTDAHAKTTTTSYTQDGQVQTTSGPQGSLTTGYDPNSGMPTTTALNGTTLATASYDGTGRMWGVTYANGTTATVGYDGNDNTTSVEYTNAANGTVIDGQQTVVSTAGRITSSSLDGSNYVPITATRIADTLTGSGLPDAGQHLGAGGTLNVQVTGANGDNVPADATAAVISVTGVGASTPTSLTVYPTGSTPPTAPTVYVAGSGQRVDNQTTTAIGAGGQVTIANAAGTLDALVDIVGYYSPASSGAGFQTVSPTRICDTRLSAAANQCNSNGTAAGTLSPGSTATVQVTGNAGVPAGATAAVVDLGAFSADPGGSFTTYPDGTTQPATTSLFYPAAGAGPAVTSWASNREDLFVRGSDNSIWHRYWNGTTWSSWESLGTTIVSNPAAISRGVNEIDLFGTGTTGSIYEKSWNGSTWSGWALIGAPSVGIAPGSGPAMTSGASNREDLFVRGNDNAIWHKYWISGTGWSSWESLGATIVSNPAAISRGVNEIDLFGTGTTGSIYEKSWNGSTWSGWTSQGAPPPGTQAGQGPAVSSWGSTRDDLFVRGADNAIWHTDWISGTGWAGWDSLGPTIVSNPAAISATGTTTIDLYGTGSDDNSYRKTWNGSAWTAWGSTGAPTVGIAPDSNGPGVNKETVVPLSSAGKFDVQNATGTTDLTVDVEGYYTATSGDQYFPLSPTTVADTRAGSGQPLAGETLGANATLTVPVRNANSDQVPANATAVVVNLTEPDATTNSTFTAYPNGASLPTTTTLTFQPGEKAANEATVSIGTSGAIAIHNTNASADLTVTVEGYFAPASTTETATYTYDGAGRLTQTANPTSTTTYGYGTTTGCSANNAGSNTNRTSLTVTGTGASTTNYCYNSADQLTSTTLNGGSPNTNYTYDPDGNQTTDSGTTLTWDSSNRMATTTTSAGSTTYTYDALDRVITQQDGSTVSEYSYAGMTTTASAILDSNGDLLDTLVPLAGGVTVTVPAAGLASSTWSYTNLQGDATLTTNNSGAPQTGPITYDPWGVPQGGSVGNTPTGTPTLGAYAAQGKLSDPNNNLITMGARPFNPSEARFLTVDPIDGGCANRYTYAFGDPLNRPDLSGKAACNVLVATDPSSITAAGYTFNYVGGSKRRIYTTDVSVGTLAEAASAVFDALILPYGSWDISSIGPNSLTVYALGQLGLGYYSLRDASSDGTPAIDFTARRGDLAPYGDNLTLHFNPVDACDSSGGTTTV